MWWLFTQDLRRWINSFSGSDFKPRHVWKGHRTVRFQDQECTPVWRRSSVVGMGMSCSYSIYAHQRSSTVGRERPSSQRDRYSTCLGPEEILYPQSGDRSISFHHSRIEAGVQSSKDPMEILVAQRQCPGETWVLRGQERRIVEPVSYFHWPHSRGFRKTQRLEQY